MSKELEKLKVGIFGYGGHALEVSHYLPVTTIADICFFVNPEYLVKGQNHLKSISEFKPTEYSLTIAIGNSKTRERIVKSLPSNTNFRTIVSIHSNCPSDVESSNVILGEGSMVGAGVALTCNLRIGKHAILNTGCCIHHGSVVGDFFTAAPGARVLGNCQVGSSVTLGANAVCIENTSICNGVVVGAGAVVTRDIFEPGVYVGVPARKLKSM